MSKRLVITVEIEMPLDWFIDSYGGASIDNINENLSNLWPECWIHEQPKAVGIEVLPDTEEEE